MSENQNNDNPVVTDSQETNYDQSQIITNSQMFNESQDFALVVREDSDESTKNQTQAFRDIEDVDKDSTEKNVVEPESTQIVEDVLATSEPENQTQDILPQVDEMQDEKGVVEDSKNDDNSDDRNIKERRGSVDEEVVQGTPPEISSPPRKSLSVKRKRESLDEPTAKIQKTLSDKDALKLDEESQENVQIGKQFLDSKLILSDLPVEKSETQSDILCQSTEYFDSNVKSDIPIKENVIIAETQETEDSEPILFDNSSDDDNKEARNKSKDSKHIKKSSLDPGDLEPDATESKPEDMQKDDSKTSKTVPFQIMDNTTVEVNTNRKDAVTNEKGNENNKVMDVTETDLPVEQIKSDVESDQHKVDSISKTNKEFFNVPLPSNESASDSNFEASSNSSNKSRQSIEVIYHRKSSGQDKKKFPEVVEIDEEGEKIVLDSSNMEKETNILDSSNTEGDKIVLDSSNEGFQLRFSTDSSNNSPQNISVYKSCLDTKSTTESSYKSVELNDVQENNEVIETSDCQITNGEEDLSTSGTTKTVSGGSEVLGDELISDTLKTGAAKTVKNNSDHNDKFIASSKLNDTMELANIVSDSEGDSIHLNDNAQNKSEDRDNISSNVSATSKTTSYEKRARFYIDLKYLVHIDDNTKEITYKEVTDVRCEPVMEYSSARRNSDASGCLADLSGNGNKDTSPGSVLSNPQPFQLPPSRFSIASTISSSSSVSSAASLAMKILKDSQFSQPKGRAKHAKRPGIDIVSEEKLSLTENCGRVTQGWKNAQFITDAVIQSANAVINSPDIFHHDSGPIKTEDKVMSSTPELRATEDKVLSSTPEPIQEEKVTSQVATPKSTKGKKPLKRARARNGNSARSNGMRKVSPEVVTTSQEDRLPLSKRKRESIDKIQSVKFPKLTPNISTLSKIRSGTPRKEALRSVTPQILPGDELIGKIVFAKWSDNNYYPGEVTDKTKSKFRVKFYDGESKLLIEEFIIPMPKILREGLSIYATTKEDDYGSVGIILQSENVNNVIYYTVDMDNGKVTRVQIKDIFLTPDQAQILKEEIEIESKSLPKTPQHLGKVSLDNLMEGKRKSRQTTTSAPSTPKSRKEISPKASRIIDSIPASGSGIPKVKGKDKEISSSESETKTSDSNVSSIEDVDGVQPELVTLPVAQISKGPSSRMKGRGRSKSKQTQDNAELGPIPPISSKIFKNMSFILTSTSSDIIYRHKTDDSCSEAGTENEEEWLKIPFVKDRVKNQLINGGGTVYDSFKLIPSTEYKNTKLITNAPNLTAKSIQCLSMGIPVYSHNWVIQCCRENKSLTAAPYELPAGWSLENNKYIEWYDRPNKQPFAGMIIGMPILDNRNEVNRSIQFWRRICENAGAGVQIIEDQETNFCHTTAILTDNRCPSWLVEKADRWQIPLVSTVWIVQCIIAGELLVHDTHPQYKHTFIQS